MKKSISICLWLSLFTPAAMAQDLFWDANGATPGSGNLGGTWNAGGANFLWTTDSTGSIPQTAWVNGSNAVFSAGADGLSFTVTLDGDVATPLLKFEEATAVNIAGDGGGLYSIAIGGGTIDSSVLGAATDQNVNISAPLSGAGGLTIAAHGDTSASPGGNSDLTLSGANTFTGDLTITSGLVAWADDGAFGNAANKIILDGGGLLDANQSHTLTRDLQVDSASTIRTYGSATLTIDGQVTGAGDINRTDGGTITLTNSTNSHSGTWNLQGGVLRLNGAGSLGTATVNNGTRLDFFNDNTAAAYSNNITGDGLTRFESSAGTTYSGTITGAGTVYVGDATNNSALTLATGADITADRFYVGESGSIAGNVTQQAGTAVEVTNQMRVGHWGNETSTYTIEDGTLDLTGTPGGGFETAGVVILGVDGTGIFNQDGGTVTTPGVGLDVRSNTAGTDQYNLNAGTLVLGGKGIGTTNPSTEFNFGGGTLQASADFVSQPLWNVNANSTLDLNDWFVTAEGNVLGSATLSLADTSGFGGGTLVLNGGSQEVAAGLGGSVPVEYTGGGTLTLSGTSSHTGTLTVTNGTLNLTGSTASAVSLDDGATIGGEGAIGGSLSFDNGGGSNTLSFDPTTEPAALAVTGGVTTAGTINLALSMPPPVTTDPITVLTFGSISGSGTFALPNSSAYRNSTITTGATSVTVDLDTQSLVWNDGALWDVGTTGGWGDGTGTFFWGDHVLFDDTSTVTTVTLAGDLQPGLVTIDSNTNDFTFAGSGGTAQVETATAAGDATADGNIDVTITSADLTGSPLTITIDVLTGETAAEWAAFVRSDLAADPDVSDLFTVGGTGADIVLTRKAVNGAFPGNDATLNIALDNGTPDPGITPALTSADTTAGVATSRISGLASLLKKGSSTLTVNGPNSYSGGTTIANGSVVVTGVNNGLGSGAITLGDATTGSNDVALLLTNARQITNPITVSSLAGGNATLGFSGGGGNYTAFTGPVTLERDLTVLGGTDDRLHFPNSISGTGTVTVEGGKRVTMSGNNSYDGDLLLRGAGTVYQTFGGNNIPDTATVDVETDAEFRVYISEGVGALTGSGLLRPVAGKPTLTLGNNGISGDFAGTWTFNGSDHLNVTKNGAGTQTFSGTVTSTGALTINDGTVTFTTAAEFGRTNAPGTAMPTRALQGDSAMQAATGADVALRRSSDGFTGTVEVADGTVTIAHPLAAGNGGGSVSLQGGTLEFDNSGSYFTPFSGEVLTSDADPETPADNLAFNITTADYATMHNTSGDIVPGNTTHAYHGRVYLTAGTWSFAKRFDDGGSVTIDGTTIINNNVWDATATGTFTAPSDGWYNVDIRVYQGVGGVGPNGGWTKGIGIAAGDTAGSTNEADYTAFEDGALGIRLVIDNNISLGRPIAVSSNSTIDTSAMVGVPGDTGTDGNGADGNVTLTASLSGAADLSKDGSGTLTIGAASNGFSGNLIADGGILRIDNQVRGAAGITVNSAGTLETDATNMFVGGHGVPMPDSYVITVDGGTWIMTGGHDARFGNVTLANGGTWTSNRGLGGYDALLANTTAGPATVTVSGLGAATMNGTGGIHLQGVQNFDVADVTGGASADLVVDLVLGAQGITGGDPGGINKTGTGTMLLNKANSYTGTTTVAAGTLGGVGSVTSDVTVAAAGTLAPGASAGTFTITGNAVINGGLAIELDGASADQLVVSGDLDITNATLDVSVLGGGATEPVYIIASYGSLTGASFNTVNGLPAGYSVVYAYNDGFSSNNIALLGATDAYTTWATDNGLENPWLGVDPKLNGEPTADPDKDGLANVIEFVLGEDPTNGAIANPPTATNDGSNLVFAFRLTDEAASYSPDIWTVEFDDDLLDPWTAAADPGNATITITPDGGNPWSTVTVEVPHGGAPALFGRLSVTIP